MATQQNTATRLQNNYVRTLEDDINDREEDQWKQQRNNAAVKEFLRRYPSGRVIPSGE